MIFAELCQHSSSKEYVNFLYKDLIEEKFELDDISESVAEDDQVFS